MENCLDIPILGLDEAANLYDYKFEDEIYPNVILQASEVANMEKNSIEPISQNNSESVLSLNEQIDAGKALF